MKSAVSYSQKRMEKTMKKKKEKGINKGLSRYLVSVLLFLLFETVAITLWLIKDNLFYLLNFSYIGTCLALGTALFTAEKRYARHFVQLAVGSYMLLYLGIISRENMQIEGFWYYLFLGVFEAAPFTMPWPKSSDRCCSDADGAAMPVGRLWFWTFFLISSHGSREKKSSEFCAM